MEVERKDKAKYPTSPSDYKLLEEVGQGVSGLVYRAFCIPLNEFVAVKQLDLEKCNGTLDNIRKEAQTMSLINHPNVVRAHCSFVVSQQLWVVMPYMGGGSCLHIMKATSPDGFEEPVIATILRETLKALEYLHRQGHIHRDVKAGNILIDESGGVKLGDFGVAACMFDAGDRQWSRNTFVGTPCWMAPEVMEQLNGYDFKADIWSFGITALELAHGHAPFSKYPPMKVLLMTLQNAAPGLTYERDKRFSKSFKEMIAMCLVKDPTKRPTAEKLLKHSFFRSARSAEYVARHILEGLPSLWERVRDVKLRDAARLAEKKMPYGEQEERSQNEYKRGVSGWNFDVEDLKAQAALIQDDEIGALPKKEEDAGCRGSETVPVSRVASPFLSPHNTIAVDEHQLSETLKAELSIDGEECIVRTAVPCPKPLNGAKVKGRFNVYVDNAEGDLRENSDAHKGEELLKEEKPEDREADDSRLPTVMEDDHGASSKTSDDEKERDHKQLNDTAREKTNTTDHKPANGFTKPPPPAGLKEEDKLKPPVVQKKGRFSVTSADVELKDLKENKDGNLPTIKVKSTINSDLGEVLSPSNGLRRTASAQQVLQTTNSPTSAAVPTAASFPSNVILPLLQNLLNQTTVQQDMIVNLMTNVCNGDPQGTSNHRLTRSASVSAVDHGVECLTDRERELRQQVSELQGRVGVLVDELQLIKLKNIQLERQLNAIFNKEEEERIRKEEAAKEDG